MTMFMPGGGDSAMRQHFGQEFFDQADFDQSYVDNLKSVSGSNQSGQLLKKVLDKSVSEELSKLSEPQVESLLKQSEQKGVAPPIVKKILVGLGGQEMVTQQGKYRTGSSAVANKSQKLRKAVGKTAKKLKSNIKTDPNYVDKIFASVNQKFGDGQFVSLPSYKWTDQSAVTFENAPFGGGRASFPKIGKFQAPDGKDYNFVKLGDSLAPEKTANRNQQVAPQLWSRQVARTSKATKLQQYLAAMNTERLDNNSAFWKSAQSAGMAKFQNKLWRIADPVTQRRFQSFVTQNSRKNNSLNAATVIYSKQLTEQQVQQSVPSLVKEIVQANSLFSASGIGPISKTSLPLYAGRFIDRVSGRVRVLPNPTTKYLNPISYNAKISYLQARVINNWNKFVQSSQQYYNMLAVKSETWEENQKKRLKKALMGSQNTRIQAVKWMLAQINAYMLGIPLSNASRVVLGTVEQIGKLTQLKTKVTALVNQKQKLTAQKLVEFTGVLEGYAKTVIGMLPKDTQAPAKTMKIARAYGVWIEKGFETNADNIKKLMRTNLPPSMDAEDVTAVQQAMDEWKDVFTKANITMTQANIDKYLAKQKAPSADDWKKQALQLKKDVISSQSRFSQQYATPKTQIKPKQDSIYAKLGRQGIKVADL